MNEPGPDLSWDAFRPTFAARIAPRMAGLERKRVERRREVWRRALSAAGLTLALTAAATALVHALAWSLVVVGVVVIVSVIAGFVWAVRPAARHKEEVREAVVPPLLGFLGGLDHQRQPRSFDIDRFQAAGVVGAHNRQSVEDLFAGRHRGTGFQMVEARLRRRSGVSGKSGARSKTVFRGLLLDIEVPVDVAATTLLVRDQGSLVGGMLDVLRRTITGMERITLDHPAFEARYQAYTNDPEEARRLLSTAVLDAMVSLADQAGKTALNAAFDQGRFLLALPLGRELFEIGKLGHGLDRFEADVRALLEQLTIPHRLIDHLHGDRPTLLPPT